MPPLTTSGLVGGAILAACFASFSIGLYKYWDVSQPPVLVLLLLTITRAWAGILVTDEASALIVSHDFIQTPLFLLLTYVVIPFISILCVEKRSTIKAIAFYLYVCPVVANAVLAASLGILRQLRIITGNIYHPVNERQIVLLAVAMCLAMPIGIAPEHPIERAKVKIRSLLVAGGLAIIVSFLPRHTRPFFSHSHSR